LNIPSSTAFDWGKKSIEAADEFVELRKAGSGRPVGRPPTLTDAHQEYLLKLVDENETGLTLDQMMESLTTEFMRLKISKSTFHEFTRKNVESVVKGHTFNLRKETALIKSKKDTIGSNT
jgi:hypothetical protein